jgi:NTE family protein
VGIAWESGLIAGLAQEGVELAAADFIVGTSAGSFVGAQLAMGRKPASLAAAQMSAQPAAVRPPGNGPSQPAPDLMKLMELMAEAATSDAPPEEVRKKIGAYALEAKTISEEQFIATFGGMLQNLAEDAWPQRNYACTAVDAVSGEFVTWGNASRVGLARAVASSCSVPGIYPPITINGSRYIDGGMRSATNADLVKGYDLAVVVSVTTGTNAADPVAAARSKQRLEEELQAIRDGGGKVELIQPDEEALAAFGPNLMDASRRPAIAEAGLKQGHKEAARLKAFWG